MAKDENIARREPQPHHCQQHISMQVTDFPRDLLQRFMNGSQLAYKNNLQHGEETEEIELSLGLSLNGRFGVDPKRGNKLSRSSSIPDFFNPVAKDNSNDTPFMVPMACANLIRTCSLPTETEEDWRKRKELQTLRRMEAKRKRSEKQRNFRIARERSRVFGEENSAEDDKKEERDGTGHGIYQVENCVPFAVPSWVDGGKGACGIAVKGGGAAVDGGLPPAAPSAVAASQGSIGSSQGSGSSGISEFETQQSQGLNKCTEAVSPSSVQSTPKSEDRSPTNPEAATAERSGKIVGVPVTSESNKMVIAEKGVKEVVRNVLEDMPCVSTKGDGPNGKRIEGFLYRYRKGEEVRIVCVCHGNFLTPAEFVKHAGGGDVTYPLKHIVVNPSSLL